MKRFIPLLAGLGLILAGGLVQGLWTDRWQEPADLEAAAARLKRLPEEVGPWNARPIELDPEALRMARAAGSWNRRFVNRRTGAEVTVILLCGKPGPMSVHRPEQCYRGAGYEVVGQPAKRTFSAAGKKGDRPLAEGGQAPFFREFWTADFVKETGHEAAGLRIFWSWYTGTRWQAPESPRLAFAHLPVLYKLYVIRSQEPTSGSDSGNEDPCMNLLTHLLPQLDRALAFPGNLEQ